jgi:hypothetical protein
MFAVGLASWEAAGEGQRSCSIETLINSELFQSRFSPMESIM